MPDKTVSAIAANLTAAHESIGQISDLIVAEDKENADLRDAVKAAVDKAALDQAAKDALQGEIAAAFDQSESVKNDLRALVPGIPPVGGTPLTGPFPSEADFRAAATAYTGPEAVTLNGNPITTGNTGVSTGTLDFFTQADGSVSTAPLVAPV